MAALVVTMLACVHLAGAQERPLAPLLQGEVAPGSPHVYMITVNAGDLVSGTLELTRGPAIAFNVSDRAGVALKDVHLDEVGRTRVGFTAPFTGSYRVAITRVHVEGGDTTSSAFMLQTATRTPSERMTGDAVAPVVRYESARILQLAREVQSDRSDALGRFWAEARQRGGPLIEPFDGRIVAGPSAALTPNEIGQHVLVTFLWRETYETYNVLPSFHLADARPNDYFMSRLRGTDVWYKTVLMPRGSRISYSLSPNSKPQDLEFTTQKDPWNPRLAWDDDPESSLLELDGAPDESWFRQTPTARGTVSERQQFKSTLLKGERPVSIYAPPGYSAARGPYPLLLLFDGVTYLTGFEAVRTLDNLISAGRIRPLVVCFLTSPATRAADLGPNANPAFAEAVATELLPWLRTSYAISTDAKDIIIGGYSAGAAGAARIAFRYPSVFGNVLSQSGALGSGPSFQTNATILAYRDASRLPIRFYLDVGLFEGLPVQLPLNELPLVEGLTAGNRHFHDVLLAKGYDVTYKETGGAHNNLHFRATLAEALRALLGPGRK